jgi:hypothetical protein
VTETAIMEMNSRFRHLSFTRLIASGLTTIPIFSSRVYDEWRTNGGEDNAGIAELQSHISNQQGTLPSRRSTLLQPTLQAATILVEQEPTYFDSIAEDAVGFWVARGARDPLLGNVCLVRREPLLG